MTMRSLTGAALLCAGLMAAPGIARAETFHTCAGFIDTVPTSIDTQGVWCLRHDVSTAITDGQAILIGANNVTIDCNGFKIGGLAAGIGTNTDGIVANDRSNVSIRNCNLRGFRIGVRLIGAGSGHAVEDNRLDGNTLTGIEVAGDGSSVRRNRIVDTGLSPWFNVDAFGIHATGSTDVHDNTIIGVSALGGVAYPYGILTVDNIGGSVTGNHIRGVVPVELGVASGIYNAGSLRLAITGNVVIGMGMAGSDGITCPNADSYAVGNVVAGFENQIQGCLDVDNTP